ncbi:MAG: methylated-DNA--[protein]-cysteine S-methyltransferase [Candidatus Eremiobacteraeota bacterium]|nr:methylated-DNA--[protein]-cysteine S-methyltransferase [Candidatus Eremiobacteraeota bacterium]
MPAILPGRSLILSTPIGAALAIRSDGERIVDAEFTSARKETRPHDALSREIAAQVRAYFRHRLDRFDLPLYFDGSEFERAIWQLVSHLHTGELISYGDVGRALGRPRTHRAVAAAMRNTPIDLFIPAHRVVGADGRVKGAGPRSLRRRLLEFEGFTVAPDNAIRA